MGYLFFQFIFMSFFVSQYYRFFFCSIWYYYLLEFSFQRKQKINKRETYELLILLNLLDSFHLSHDLDRRIWFLNSSCVFMYESFFNFPIFLILFRRLRLLLKLKFLFGLLFWIRLVLLIFYRCTDLIKLCFWIYYVMF